MYNMEDILARLRNGENADAIATELTNAMNSALEAHKAEVAAKEAEAARAKAEAEAEIKSKALKDAKIKAMYSILTEIYNYILDFCVDSTNSKVRDFIDTIFEQITPEEAVEFVDKIANELKNDPMTEVLINCLNNDSDNKNFYNSTGVYRDKPIKLSKSDDDILDEFLKAFNLK